ncbi:MAG: phosphoglycerate dehydrogenase [Phycisphaerae bacterium]
MADKIKILVADKLSPLGIEWLENQDDVEVTNKPGQTPEELKADIGEYDGVIVRSGAKITADVLEEKGRLKGIARAGVGVDNIDVPVATAKGVIVMNTPGGNTVSTAELAFTLMMALSRKIAQASASLKSGAWDRKKFQGTQLAGKTLGVVGMGRIGQEVAKRAKAFEMRVIGYDPFFAGSEESDVEMIKDLKELCKRADYITVHVPKTPETTGMIGEEEIAVMKPTVRLINAARGGVIDPEALLKGIKEERVAGAALDVWTSEPPETAAEKELIDQPNVLSVPHLGASTEEAQDQVALDAAEQLVTALRGGEVRNALNAPGFGAAIPEWMMPYTELSKRLGTVLAATTPGAIQKVEVIFRGKIADANVAPLTTHLLVGLMSPHMDHPVNIINAPVLADERGVEVDQITSAKVKEFTNMVEVAVTTDKMKRTAKGSIFGNRFPRVISIDGFRMEMKPEGHVLIIFNDDKPGVVGQYGTILGANDINIADMTFSRKLDPPKALVGINLDSQPSEQVLDELRNLEFVDSVYYLELPILYQPEVEAAS